MRVGTRRSPAVTKATTTRTTERRRQPHSARRNLRGLLPLLAIWGGACAAPTGRPSVRPAVVADRPLHHGPLSDFISAANLRWLILVRPQQVLADPELGPAIFQIVASRRFDAFAESSGVDLRTLSAGAVAGFPYATLYLAEVPNGVAERARASFSDRLVAGAITKRPRPSLVRIAGVVGQTPESLVTIDDRTLAVAVGDPIQAKVAEAYAEERLKNSPTALRGAALSSLPDLYTGNAAVLLAPGPFDDEWQRAAGGLLQSTVAVGIAARPIGNGKIATTLCLSGAWDESAEAAAARLAAAWTTLARSSTGRLFDLPESAEITASPELLTLRVELALGSLVHGLQASVLTDVTQILSVPSKPGTDAAPRESIPTP